MSKPDLHLYRPHPGSAAGSCHSAPDPSAANRSADGSASCGDAAGRRGRELDRLSGVAEAKCVTVSLAAIVPLLVDATEHNRAWLNDFADDVVRIDADLYDVLLAYQQLQQRAAA